MPVITMNVPCTIATRTGSDMYGQPTLGVAKPTVCAVIKLELKRAHTTVRTDSGATHGHADEETSYLKILVSPRTQVGIDDVLTVRDHAFRVVSLRPMYNVMGKVDHIEVEGE